MKIKTLSVEKGFHKDYSFQCLLRLAARTLALAQNLSGSAFWSCPVLGGEGSALMSPRIMALHILTSLFMDHVSQVPKHSIKAFCMSAAPSRRRLCVDVLMSETTP